MGHTPLIHADSPEARDKFLHGAARRVAPITIDELREIREHFHPPSRGGHPNPSVLAHSALVFGPLGVHYALNGLVDHLEDEGAG